MHDGIAVLDARELDGSQGAWQCVDVRTASEYAAGHVPGAVNVPLDELESRMGDLDSERPVMLICKAGQRAAIAHGLLTGRRSDLHVLEGGTDAWVRAGLPVVRSAKTRWSLERQVRLGAGLLVLTGVVLGAAVGAWWYLLAGFVGAGLTFAGATDICGMGMLLGKMPWNRAVSCATPAQPMRAGAD